jgi:hypothetical protein
LFLAAVAAPHCVLPAGCFISISFPDQWRRRAGPKPTSKSTIILRNDSDDGFRQCKGLEQFGVVCAFIHWTAWDSAGTADLRQQNGLSIPSKLSYNGVYRYYITTHSEISYWRTADPRPGSHCCIVPLIAFDSPGKVVIDEKSTWHLIAETDDDCAGDILAALLYVGFLIVFTVCRWPCAMAIRPGRKLTFDGGALLGQC